MTTEGLFLKIILCFHMILYFSYVTIRDYGRIFVGCIGVINYVKIHCIAFLMFSKSNEFFDTLIGLVTVLFLLFNILKVLLGSRKSFFVVRCS